MFARPTRTRPTGSPTADGNDRLPFDPLGVTWWDPANDTALASILSSAKARCVHDLPDVDVEPDALIPEFDELTSLIHQRLRSLQAQAQAGVAPDVELVAGMIGTVSDAGPEVDSEPGVEAATAARAARVRARVSAARERVRSASAAHGIAVAAQLAYGQEALARLDATVRDHHRHATWLTYAVPVLAVPHDVHEIGLARIEPLPQTGQESDAAPTDQDDAASEDTPPAALPPTG
jgi:hypothetical protein